MPNKRKQENMIKYKCFSNHTSAMSFFVMIVSSRFAMFMVVVVAVVAYGFGGCLLRPLAVVTSDGLPGLLPPWGLIATVFVLVAGVCHRCPSSELILSTPARDNRVSTRFPVSNTKSSDSSWCSICQRRMLCH